MNQYLVTTFGALFILLMLTVVIPNLISAPDDLLVFVGIFLLILLPIPAYWLVRDAIGGWKK